VQTTPWGLPYPESTDDVELWDWFQGLADKVNEWMTVPDESRAGSTANQTITATAYANLPTTSLAVSITNPSSDWDLEVDVEISAWLISDGTRELTCSVAGSGGMTFAAGSLSNGHAITQGENLINTGTAAVHCSSRIPVVIPAGAAAVTFTFQAKRNTATGVQSVNSAAIRAIPQKFRLP
jgi:hypothetical protein